MDEVLRTILAQVGSDEPALAELSFVVLHLQMAESDDEFVAQTGHDQLMKLLRALRDGRRRGVVDMPWLRGRFGRLSEQVAPCWPFLATKLEPSFARFEAGSPPEDEEAYWREWALVALVHQPAGAGARVVMTMAANVRTPGDSTPEERATGAMDELLRRESVAAQQERMLRGRVRPSSLYEPMGVLEAGLKHTWRAVRGAVIDAHRRAETGVAPSTIRRWEKEFKRQFANPSVRDDLYPLLERLLGSDGTTHGEAVRREDGVDNFDRDLERAAIAKEIQLAYAARRRDERGGVGLTMLAKKLAPRGGLAATRQRLVRIVTKLVSDGVLAPRDGRRIELTHTETDLVLAEFRRRR